MNLPVDLGFLARLGEAAFAGYWMPQLVWVVLAGIVLLAIRTIRLPQPLLGYQMITALLLALPAGMLLAPFTRFEVAAPWRWLAGPASSGAGVSVGSLLATADAPAGPAWTVDHTIGLLTLLAFGLAAVQLAAFVRRLRYLDRLRDVLAVSAPAAIVAQLDRLRVKKGISSPVALYVTSHDHSPVTFGWRRPAIILPVSLLDDEEALTMTLEHELIHVAHHDYARGVAESLIRSFFFLNPAVHWGVQRVERFRELACDAELLSQDAFSRKRYASLLARFAFQPSTEQRLAVFMSSAGRLKERVQAMHTYRGGPGSPRALRTWAFASAMLFFALGVTSMGCEITFDRSLTVNQYSQAPETEGNTTLLLTPAEDGRAGDLQLEHGDQVFMIVEDMPKLSGGLRELQASIQYPDIARRAGIEGRVFIQFVVDAEGRVQDPTIVRGIGGGCDEEALRAVSQARFTPGRQRGIPVAVKMSLPITFKLEDPSES